MSKCITCIHGAVCDDFDGNSSKNCNQFISMNGKIERHGHWIPINQCRNSANEYECSECIMPVYLDSYTYDCDYDFCPYCATIMDEE